MLVLLCPWLLSRAVHCTVPTGTPTPAPVHLQFHHSPYLHCSIAHVQTLLHIPSATLLLFLPRPGVLKFKRASEELLQGSGMPYTILRPSRLTDGPYTSYDLNTLLKVGSRPDTCAHHMFVCALGGRGARQTSARHSRAEVAGLAVWPVGQCVHLSLRVATEASQPRHMATGYDDGLLRF